MDPRRTAEELGPAFQTFAREGASVVIVSSLTMFLIQRRQIAFFALASRLPTIYPFRFYVAAGGLASYGPDFLDQYRQAAGYVARVITGDKPGDLPIQLPTKFEFVINLRTAQRLGVQVPPTLLAQVDEVIE